MIVISKSKTVTSSNQIVELMMRLGYDSRSCYRILPALAIGFYVEIRLAGL